MLKATKTAATQTVETIETAKLDLLDAIAVAPKAAKVATPDAPKNDGWKVLPAGEWLIRTSLKWAKGLKGCNRPHAISNDGGETWTYVKEIELTGTVSIITLKTGCMKGRTTAMKTTGTVRVK